MPVSPPKNIYNRRYNHVSDALATLHGGPKKRGHRLSTIILPNLKRFRKFFHWKIPWSICGLMDIRNPTAPRICCLLMSAKQAINDKLQGNVGTYLKCGRVVSNHIKEGLLLSPTVKKSRKIGEYLAKLQART